MLTIATDWATLSSAATALGTLVLAVATFIAVRSSNASARIAETALQEQRRPVITHSRLTDPVQKMMYGDRHWVKVDGGRAAVEHVDGTCYLAISLRNVGQGMAVCQGWTVAPSMASLGAVPRHAPLDQFRTQTRDLYIPAGDIGMWQGALRDPNDPVRSMVCESIDNAEPISIEILYSDMVGGQRTVTRFSLFPSLIDDVVVWYASMARHWHLDHAGPRSEAEIQAASASIQQHLRPASAPEDDPVS